MRLPSDFRAHYLVCNGGVPERRCWVPEGDDPICLKRLFAFRVRDTDDDGDTISDVLAELRDGGHLPDDLVPFADDRGGNYFCVQSEGGRIFWFAMDLGDDFERARRELASSFEEFVTGLTVDPDE